MNDAGYQLPRKDGEDYDNRVDAASAFLKDKIGSAEVGLILGSGLGEIAGDMDGEKRIAYRDIPGFPRSTIPGHRGELIAGEKCGKRTIIMSGRFHYYQGYSLRETTLPVRVLRRLGVESLIITNSSGGINERFKNGDIMLISDHINLIPDNPLRGPVTGGGSPFVELSDAYDGLLRDRIKRIARENPSIGELREGVYIAVPGPSYETAAEIKFYRTAGADAVGMSTVPEVIVAKEEGMHVIGISAISNLATGMRKNDLTHDEVIQSTRAMSGRLILLIEEILGNVL